MMKVIVVFKCLLASGNDQHGRHLFKWGNRWNILGFNFTKRDALSSVYKISMIRISKSEHEDHMELLLLGDSKGNLHYVLIKDVNRMLNSV
jgi:hypothetical protein